MKRVFLLLIMLMLFSYSSATAQTIWEWQSPSPQGNGLYDVCFINQNTAVAVGMMGTIIRTNDGGETWIHQVSGVESYIYADSRLRSVSFIDENTGMVAGDISGVLKTTDGGDTWELLQSTTGGFTDIQMTSPTTAYAVNANQVAKTTDGGETWTYTSDVGGTGLFFIDSFTGWICGGEDDEGIAVIYRTTDGGTNWTSYSLGWSRPLSDIYFSDERNGVFVGSDSHTLIYRTTNGGETWFEDSYEIDNENLDLRDVSLSDQYNGIAVGEGGTILRTTDGGENWLPVVTDETEGFLGVSFADANTGLAVGGSGIMMKTTDGGATWESLLEGTRENLLQIFVLNSTTAYVVGENSTVLRTTNKGEEWEQLPFEYDDRLHDVDFYDENTGWIVGWGGKIYKTTDGGENWVEQSSGTTNNLYGIQFLNENTGYAVGGNEVILKTTNGGTDWYELENSGQSKNIYDVVFLDENTGMVCGLRGLVLKTTDGGATWETINTGSSASFNKISFVDNNTAYLAGSQATLLKTTDGGDTWTELEHSMSGTLRSLDFKDADNGVITEQDGILYRTTDGGSTWVTEITKTYNSLSSVAYVDENNIWAVGAEGTIIYKDEENTVSMTAPSNLQAAADTASIYIGWQDNTSIEEGYVIERKESGGSFGVIDTVVSNTVLYEDTTVTKDILYTYRIFAYNAAQKSGYSNEVEVGIITEFVPDAPSELSALTNTEDVTVTLSWTDNSDNEEGFVVERKTSSTDTYTEVDSVDADAESYTDNTVSANVTYVYRIYAYNSTGASGYSNLVEAQIIVNGIEDEDVPNSYRLEQNYPNPFNPTTQIKFGLPYASNVKITIYNMLGQRVTELVNETLASGYHEMEWDASKLSSGVYIYRLQANSVTGKESFSSVKKMMLLK